MVDVFSDLIIPLGVCIAGGKPSLRAHLLSIPVKGSDEGGVVAVLLLEFEAVVPFQVLLVDLSVLWGMVSS